ncbi:hypothetical protein D7Z26_02350 [Cohnella endophytica]|uniref:Uncharacterized protein n=1 Tax=Cohnella endophytica TaxID=2419778 RepID=A0A494Y3H1_9BACL|nr:hypothetical protein [Cohnella endophytica]RKP56851.1 hypothetical protein D7Z26_02350 [Cohnella endophytica]
MSRTKIKRLYALFALLIVYLVFFPSPTPEIAVRKHLFFSFHPMKAITKSIHEGTIKNDPRYGDEYEVNDLSQSYFYVKKNALGWRVTSTGSGP